MRNLALLAGVVCLTVASPSAPQKSSPPPAQPPAAAKKQPAKKAATTPQKRAPSRKKSPSKQRPAWRAGQQTPTRERYTEIQQALIARAYLERPATGAWGPEWAAALKKFQADQNLEPSGKLDSLSLIALGLGPKREANRSRPSTPPRQVPPTSEPKQP